MNCRDVSLSALGERSDKCSGSHFILYRQHFVAKERLKWIATEALRTGRHGNPHHAPLGSYIVFGFTPEVPILVKLANECILTWPGVKRGTKQNIQSGYQL